MLTAGTVLQNRYRIASRLGEGRFGDVYRAWHLSLNAPAAIKEMVPQPGLDAAMLTKLRQQFQQEATVLIYLNHPHLVRVTDFFEEGGNAYLVMNLVEGESLAERIAREGALPETQVLAWADQLLDALAYCHGRGVIHRDVKPQNVIVRPERQAPPRGGEIGGGAVLVDFGLVKLWDPDDPHTRMAMRDVGTSEYAPPEQYDTKPGHTDPRGDLYSLGATLYHALTGQAPPTAGDRTAASAPFPAVRELNPQVSTQTEAAVDRAMALRVPDRFQDATEMRAALGMGAPPAVPARRPPTPRRRPTEVMPEAPTTARRVPAWAWAVGGVVVLIMCMVLVLGAFGVGQAPVLTFVAVSATPLPPKTIPAVVPPPVAPPTTTPAVAPSPVAPPAGITLGDVWIRPADGMAMLYVPAGEFEMGSATGDAEERPVHTVVLDSFWIDQYEVTNGQYRRCVAAGACDPPEESSSYARDSYYGSSAYDAYPVIYVDWHQATAYCEWAGGRLPTEAEWEYAARGPEGRVYPWGDSAPDCDKANCSGCVGDTAAVGSHPAGIGWCGALDMTGNVLEWTADRYGACSSGRQENPTGPSSGDSRVARGGSWRSDRVGARCAYRDWHPPHSTYHHVGFRCVFPASSGF